MREETRTWLHRAAKTTWLRRLILALSGLSLGASVTFEMLGAFAWIALAPAAALFFLRAADDGVRLRGLYMDGLCFNYAFSIVVLHWFVYMYPLEFVTDVRAVALCIVLVAVLGLSLLQSLFGALLPVVLGLLCRGRFLRRWPILSIVALAALWSIREWCWTLIWSGVPWGRLALSQAAHPLMLQSARWFGSYFITFVIVLVNGAFAYMRLHANARRLCAVIMIGAFSFNLAIGYVRLTVEMNRPVDETIKVAAIQGNVGSADKWNATKWDCYQIYYALTKEAAEAGADLIVWPETAVPFVLDRYAEEKQELQELAREHEAVLLLGVFVFGENGEDYNAIRVIDADGTYHEDFYAKRHLVPFGEYVPLRPLIEIICPPLLEISQLASESTPGDDAAVFDTAVGQLGSLICFDSIYEMLAIDSARSGAELLCISTNDSWFFDSAAVYMHNAQAKLRAIETGRYVVRAANTGVSSVISPMGAEINRLDALLEGIVWGKVELRDDTTLYTKTGNLFVWLCIAGCILVLGERGISEIHRAKKNKQKEI